MPASTTSREVVSSLLVPECLIVYVPKEMLSGKHNQRACRAGPSW